MEPEVVATSPRPVKSRVPGCCGFDSEIVGHERAPRAQRLEGVTFFRGSLCYGKWRNAVDLRHLPEGTHSLAPRPGSLVRWTFREGSDQ